MRRPYFATDSTPIAALLSGPMPESFWNQAPDDSYEDGFILAGATVFILVIVAMISTFVFVLQRDSSYQSNHAAGESMAYLASHGHLFAQRYFYHNLQNGDPDDPAVMYGDLLFDSDDQESALMPLSSQFFSGLINGINYGVEIRGWSQSPINTQGVISGSKAASAYMQIKIRPTAGHVLRPSDFISFLAGAHNHGLTQPGIVGQNIPTGDTCDGNSTIVRWSNEEAGCLNSDHLTMLGFSDVQTGDIIIPTWYVALNTAAPQALFRFKQPERPELNAMMTDLDMQDMNIAQTNHTFTQHLRQPDDGETTIEQIHVRAGHGTQIQGAAITHNGLNISLNSVSDPNAIAMQIQGTTIFTLEPSDNFSVANTIQVDPASPTVRFEVDNIVDMEHIRSMTEDLAILPYTESSPIVPVVATRGMLSPIQSLAITKNGSQLAILGTLDAQSGSTLTSAFTVTGEGNPLSIYTADLVTSGMASPSDALILSGDPESGPLFRAGAVEQTGFGANQYIRVDTLNIFDCSGFACPDAVRTNPEGGL